MHENSWHFCVLTRNDTRTNVCVCLCVSRANVVHDFIYAPYESVWMNADYTNEGMKILNISQSENVCWRTPIPMACVHTHIVRK